MMNSPEKTMSLAVGDNLPEIVIPLDLGREQLFIDMAHSTCGGKLQFAPPNIHNDLEFAKLQGLTMPVYDGLIATAAMESALRLHFGEGYVSGGRLMTKFIRPHLITNDGDRLRLNMSISSVTREGDAERFGIDLKGYDKNNALVVVGEASALVAASGAASS
jgi:acyl dehydratase